MLPDLEHLQGWIGREDVAAELLHEGLVDRFIATVTGARAAGAVAPQMIHLCLAPPAVTADQLGPDGHPARGGFLPPVPHLRRMWGGGAVEFHAPLLVGERITRRSRVADLQAKQGRSGVLCFVTVEHRVFSADRLAVVERQDIVYRHVAPTPLPGGTPALAGEHTRQIELNPTLLFRYSALTFNGHRIHYDRPYVVAEELYPGLVVHGPLQATLLVQFAAELLGRPVQRFAFRSLSPLFDTAPMVLHAATAAGGLRLWTARPDGPVAMEATAE